MTPSHPQTPDRPYSTDPVEQARMALCIGIGEQIARVRCDSSAPATTRPDLIDALIAAVRAEAHPETEQP